MSRRSRLIVVAIWTLMAPLSYTPSVFGTGTHPPFER
jgi:hypothetical protein